MSVESTILGWLDRLLADVESRDHDKPETELGPTCKACGGSGRADPFTRSRSDARHRDSCDGCNGSGVHRV